MTTIVKRLVYLMLFCFSTTMYSHTPKNTNPNSNAQNQNINFREDCAPATAQKDMAINNVRARLLTGGDLWWDGSENGRYIVPKVEPESGIPERSSIFAGAVWLGGVDPAGNLKVAAQTYGGTSSTDFWPGPLTTEGAIGPDTCAQWDKFFTVFGAEIDAFLLAFNIAQQNGDVLNEADIPEGIKGWPGRGNPFFFDVHNFELPNTIQGLAPFHDEGGDGNYNPLDGDYPIIEIRGCDAPQYPDEMNFWIYNDAGGIHTQSQSDEAIRMEIQAQGFAYAANDELNDMTFQRYKLINRAVEYIDSTFFAMWVDADLGCFDDDFIGCDTSRSMMYIYNEDAQDGQTGCECSGVNTYCDEIPILGVDYFRGPLDEYGDEIGMSSFTYYNNLSYCDPEPGTTDPENKFEFYNYMTGSWKDGTRFTNGGSHYNIGSTDYTSYAFPGRPDNQTDWSMCTANLGCGDRRTVQASGPFRLDPGAVNELIIGVVWTPDIAHPCPDITPLLFADDLAQALFDNCFDITDGPDAPDVDFIEMDRKLVAVLSNDEIISNNAFEQYEETDLRAPEGTEDSLYRFEGYKIYQLAGPTVSLGELDNIEKARIVAQVDKRNGVKNIYNWTSIADPFSPELIWTPTEKVNGADDGLLHTFSFTEDQFALGDRRLINHKKYYYTALAYAHNSYEPYDMNSGIGQRTPYIEGRRNVNVYVPIPHPSVTEVLNSDYGDHAVITRIDGVGAGSNFLDVSDEERNSFLAPDFDHEITYLEGRAPITVNVYNPFEVQDGEFELTLIDENMSNDDLDNVVTWKLTNLTNGEVIVSETSIDQLNEQLISEYGFSVIINQSIEPGDNPLGQENGAIGIEVEYQDPSGPAWLTYAPLGELFVNYIKPNPLAPLDFNRTLSSMGNREFVPYTLCDWVGPETDNIQEQYITPAWMNSANNSEVVQVQNPLESLNNVDIVFTSDKSKWSRCVVVETASTQFTDGDFGLGLETELDPNIANAHEFSKVDHMDLRGVPSVGPMDADGDGKADPDGELDEDGKPKMGMGWFPGYAVDVETGQRLNIFFGENSTYDNQVIDAANIYEDGKIITQDLIWNPSSQDFLPIPNPTVYNAYAGGQHIIYVSDTPYDECEYIYSRMSGADGDVKKINVLKNVKWASIPFVSAGNKLLNYNDGLIPNDVVVKIRVENSYKVKAGTNEFNGYPTYRFSFEGVQAEELVEEVDINHALDMINVVPNPYYGYSAYETSQFTNTIKITNLPAKCTVKIFSIDGKFIKQYNRNEVGVLQTDRNNPGISITQITPDLEWDLKNSKGIPVASGVYLIHIEADGLGERVIKWFGVGRQFDPSGL